MDSTLKCYCGNKNWACLQDAPLSLTTLRRMTIAILQNVWSSPENLDMYEDNLKCLIWNPDPLLSRLDIKITGEDNFGDTNAVPDIIVSFPSGINYSPSGLNQVTRLSSDNAKVKYTSLCTAQCNIMHRHKDAGIASQMADATVAAFHSVQDKFYHLFGNRWYDKLIINNVSDIKLEGASQEDQGYFVVNVAMTYYGQYNTSSTVESKRLKDFTV